MEEITNLIKESDLKDFELLNDKEREYQVNRKSYFPQKYYKLSIILISIFILFITSAHDIKEMDINKALNQTQNKTKTYCLLYNVENTHLLKELGLLAWGMHKYLGYDSFMATYKNGNYDYLKYLPGLRLEFIPKIDKDFLYDSLTWLKSNAKRIDVLHLFHIQKRTRKQLQLYKKVNPSGRAYLKLDGIIEKQNIFKDTSIIDFISVEFKEFTNDIAKVLKRPVGFVPNPIHPDEIQEFRKFENRSNNIFYVGRVESDKGSHTLLEAFVKIHDKIPNWKLTLAGSINNKLTIAKNFFNIYPHLKGKVIFTGNINDRDRLIELYRNSQGCFPIVSNIRPNKLLTNNFKYAFYHERDNSAQLADKLLYACLHEAEIEKLAILGRNAMVDRCDLEKCSKTIHEGVFSKS